MSEKLISRSPDLLKLRDEGFEVEVRSGFVLLRNVPYVTALCKVAYGTIVTNLDLNGDITRRPDDHQVWFAGEFPCKSDGTAIAGIAHSTANQTLFPGCDVQHRFSNKPADGYADYHAKLSRYAEIISNEARAIDPSVRAQTFKPVAAVEEESIFLYTDSASSRAGIASIATKLAMRKIAIVGVGGTGAYVLDLVAKTHAIEIHLFDGDWFLQHNAFRAPGAANFESLEKRLSKIAYFAGIYSQMRKGVIPHFGFIDDATVGQLAGFDFVFICVDRPAVRKLVSEFLRSQNTPFIDTGMDLELLEDQQCLIGSCRVTMSTPEKSGHFTCHVSTEDSGADEVYQTNIQVADLNALSAALAVVKWKKYCTYYQDCYKEHQSVYAINAHQLSRDEMTGVAPE